MLLALFYSRKKMALRCYVRGRNGSIALGSHSSVESLCSANPFIILSAFTFIYSFISIQFCKGPHLELFNSFWRITVVRGRRAVSSFQVTTKAHFLHVVENTARRNSKHPFPCYYRTTDV